MLQKKKTPKFFWSTFQVNHICLGKDIVGSLFNILDLESGEDKMNKDREKNNGRNKEGTKFCLDGMS